MEDVPSVIAYSDFAAPGCGEMVVGFDLDATLIDTTPAIAATLAEAARRVGVTLDIPRLIDGLGPGLRDLLESQVSPEIAARLAACYREVYRLKGIQYARALPGAAAAVAAVRRRGGRLIMITGQREDTARLHLARERLPVAEVIGSAGGASEKRSALLAHGVLVYVGDQPTDIAAAVGARATAVAVATGRHTRDELGSADVVLDSLEEFPAWFAAFRPLSDERLPLANVRTERPHGRST
ncbi:HAD family hydrolase [Nonomuraea sp. NPDC050786]|uniref:HAD family hydrolase n=1 Tax=Nonomuraea sp. NPDC050786 TaxID=3154840 RepID=UPI0033F8FBAD